MRVLVTGGAGFIGHHLIEHILKNTDWEIVSLDRLDTSGNLNRLKDIGIWEEEKRRVSIVYHDLKAEINSLLSSQIGDVNMIFHLAAASHVDRSIEDPLSFVQDNVVGTCNLLNFAYEREQDLDLVVNFSTDEVFGPAPPGTAYKEWDRYNCGNPYSATKAGAEELCLAFHNTYELPIIITHTMNVFGERQHPEKFIPLVMRKVCKNEMVTIHADPTKTKAGSRFYIHARNVAAAILFLSEEGTPGEKYNIVGEKEVDNLEMAERIAALIGVPLRHEMVDFHGSRPGHDLRYALDGSLMKEMGWEIPVTFHDSLQRTVKWTMERQEWIKI